MRSDGAGWIPQRFLAFIAWQCERFGEWQRFGPLAVAKEYRTNVGQTIYLYRVITREDYDQVIARIGVDPALVREVLPDWIERQREAAVYALRRWIAPELQVFSPVGHDVTADEVVDFVEWLSTQGPLQFLLVFAQLGEVRKLEGRVRPPILAKTVEGLGTTVEHMLNQLTRAAPPSAKSAKSTLSGKLRRLWEDEPNVCGQLSGNWRFTRTDPGFAAQQAAICEVTTGTPWEPLVKLLLEGVLIRNHVHPSFQEFEEEALYDCLRLLLRMALVVWKHGRLRGLA